MASHFNANFVFFFSRSVISLTWQSLIMDMLLPIHFSPLFRCKLFSGWNIGNLVFQSSDRIIMEMEWKEAHYIQKTCREHLWLVLSPEFQFIMIRTTVTARTIRRNITLKSNSRLALLLQAVYLSNYGDQENSKISLRNKKCGKENKKEEFRVLVPIFGLIQNSITNWFAIFLRRVYLQFGILCTCTLIEEMIFWTLKHRL